MIDLQTYRKMHPDASSFKYKSRRNDLGEAKMASDNPPDQMFLLLLPVTIFGFNLKDKSWGKSFNTFEFLSANQKR